MTFNEYLRTPPGRELYVGPDSKDYKKYKRVWEDAQQHFEPKVITKIEIREIPIDVIVEVPAKKKSKTKKSKTKKKVVKNGK